MHRSFASLRMATLCRLWPGNQKHWILWRVLQA
jgi:hypothetical protein